jgi:hypothetical protein
MVNLNPKDNIRGVGFYELFRLGDEVIIFYRLTKEGQNMFFDFAIKKFDFFLRILSTHLKLVTTSAPCTARMKSKLLIQKL